MDIEKLANDAFWKKKLRHAFHTQDVDKDGFISRADFDLVVQRYQEMGSSNEHTKKLKDTFNKCCDEWGLTDSSVKFTIDEILDIHGKQLGEMKKLDSMYSEMFDSVDMNGNGSISFEEWSNHYQSLGIDLKHARPSFDAMDFNGDNQVSRNEFITYHKEFFFSTEDKLNSSILYGPLD